MLTLDHVKGILADGSRRFDPVTRSWRPHAGQSKGETVTPAGGALWLQRESGHPLRVPVGVIGPREASANQLILAEAIGAGLAGMGLALLCGGRQGVMEAAARGAAARGGISIGLLPDADPSLANPYVTVPIATGIGEARNALVARAAFCLIAVGDSYGTLSEIALGLQFGKAVLGIGGAARLPEVQHFEDVEGLLDATAKLVLGMKATAGSEQDR